MAAGAFVFPDKAIHGMFKSSGLLSATAANFRLALLASAYTPAPTTMEVLADVTNELANGDGYATGGGSLANVALTRTGGTLKFTCDAYVWTASGAGIPAWRTGLVYYLGSLNSLTNPIVGYFFGVSGGASDVPLTTAGNTLTVTPNASGILTAAQV
jgi:hypothetical protein